MYQRGAIFVLVLVLLACLGGCASFEDPVAGIVNAAGLESRVVRAQPFDHLLIANRTQRSTILHVYIGSDGTPWLGGRQIATDPTPRNPLALRLMAMDERASIYLGRPCYFGLNHQPECTGDVWTHGRYSGLVVDSMANALMQAQASMPFETTEWVLIGYSGGAVIATLLAQRLPNVSGLITIAGNLDTDLWTESRGFLPLTHSLNPARIKTFRTDIMQVHLIGEQDRIVPNSVTRSFTDRHGGEVWNYPEFDHSCCWENEWPRILEQIEAVLEAP